MAVVQEKKVRLSVGKTLVKSVVADVKAAGDTGILTDINNNLGKIIGQKLSTDDFNTTIAALQEALQGTSEDATLTALATALAELQSGVLTEDTFREVAKTYYDDLSEKIANIDLTEVTDRLDDADHGLAAIKTDMENVARESAPQAIEEKVGDVESILAMLNEGTFKGDPSYSTAAQVENVRDLAIANQNILSINGERFLKAKVYFVSTAVYTEGYYASLGFTSDLAYEKWICPTAIFKGTDRTVVYTKFDDDGDSKVYCLENGTYVEVGKYTDIITKRLATKDAVDLEVDAQSSSLVDGITYLTVTIGNAELKYVACGYEDGYIKWFNRNVYVLTQVGTFTDPIGYLYTSATSGDTSIFMYKNEGYVLATGVVYKETTTTSLATKDDIPTDYATSEQADLIADHAKMNSASLLEYNIYITYTIGGINCKFVVFEIVDGKYYAMRSTIAESLNPDLAIVYISTKTSDKNIYVKNNGEYESVGTYSKLMVENSILDKIDAMSIEQNILSLDATETLNKGEINCISDMDNMYILVADLISVKKWKSYLQWGNSPIYAYTKGDEVAGNPIYSDSDCTTQISTIQTAKHIGLATESQVTELDQKLGNLETEEKANSRASMLSNQLSYHSTQLNNILSFLEADYETQLAEI